MFACWLVLKYMKAPDPSGVELDGNGILTAGRDLAAVPVQLAGCLSMAAAHLMAGPPGPTGLMWASEQSDARHAPPGPTGLMWASEQSDAKTCSRGQVREGHRPEERWAPTQRQAFRYPAQYFCTPTGTFRCRRSLLVASDVVFCLSEVGGTGGLLEFASVVEDPFAVAV